MIAGIETFKAAVLVEPGKPLVLAEVRLPGALAPGQVLVKVAHSGICGSQLGEIDGAKGPDPYLPHLLGHEGSGTVLAVGAGVRHVAVGDRVVLHWRKGLGIEAEPPAYEWDCGRLNAGWVTTFNTCAIVSENRVTAVPDDTDPELAALFGCAVTTGFGVIVNNARLTIGESVVVFGAGGVGLSMVQAAAMVSAYPIVAVDLYDAKLALARSLGATHAVNGREADARRAILDAVGAAGPDVFIDNTGDPAVIQLGYEIARPQGRVVLVGVPRHEQRASFHTLALHFGKTITGSHGGDTVPQRDIPRYLAMHRGGRLPLDGLVTDRFGLDEINEAIAAVRAGRVAGRCLIRM